MLSQSGVGYAVLDVLVIFLVASAAIIQLAIYRDRGIRETQAVDAARLLMFSGYTILAVRWAVLFVQNDLDLLVPPSVEIGVGLTALAQCVLAGNRLMTHGDTNTETGDAGR